MSLSKDGLDFERLWDRKRQAVEQTPGLTIWRGGETFNQIGGCENIKRFLDALIHGEEAPRVVVFVDEIEKAFAGSGTDTSGVKTEMTGTMLSWMQDRNADGVIFIGPPGAAKSAVAKAAGATAGIPTVAFDLSAMQSSLVGGSGERLRSALQVVDAICQGRSLWIATCNSITSLPPELRRRFTLGTFFFDLPTAEEREAIWNIYEQRWKVSGERPDDDGWTGAEIKECCRKAWRLKLSLRDSASYIVPVSRSATDQIEALRRQASGRFLNSSRSGPYSDSPAGESVTVLRRVIRTESSQD
jgi:SpoVK/Ycf46/Vps4 family AAA+-type ATPase